MVRVTYETIKETFEKEGCQLLTTKCEMVKNNMNTNSNYIIIAECGHQINNCNYHAFNSKLRGRKKICTDCINKKLSDSYKKLNKNIDGNCYSLLIEAQSIQLIKKYINLDIKVSPECCLADICIKDKSCLENKWLPIQVKATLKLSTDNGYVFGLKHKYNILIIFICIEEEKIWIINGNNILNNKCLSIGFKKSKYDKYKVDKKDLNKKLLEFYNTISTDTIENIQTPITNCCKKEQLYRKLRENKLNNIKFEYPEVNQCVYDFKINNYKVQEKTAHIRKNFKHYISVLHKKKEGISQIPYDSGDNDFYWINLQDNQTFYIIPENILIEKQIISSENIVDKSSFIKGRKCLSFSKRNKWLENYKYSYNEENINEIIKILF